MKEIKPNVHPDSNRPGAMGTIDPDKYGKRTGPGIICTCDLHISTGSAKWFCDYHGRCAKEKSMSNEPKWCPKCKTKTCYKEIARGGHGGCIIYVCRKCNHKVTNS